MVLFLSQTNVGTVLGARLLKHLPYYDEHGNVALLLPCCVIYILHFSLIVIKITHKLQVIEGFYKQSINCVNPDQLASEKPADFDLHCIQNTNRFSMIRLKM